MRKIWISATMIPIFVGLFLAIIYFTSVPLGEANLKAELIPNPPWQAKSGQTLQLSIRVANDAGLFSPAKNVHAAILAPENFKVYGSGTNEYNIYLGNLRSGEGRDSSFNLTIPHTVTSGNYSATIRVLADNVPEQTLTAEINVTQSVFIP